MKRGGRCLIPVFALGRAQELLLILDEYWNAHPELQSIPIYYASSLAKKCMTVYQTYINMMNDRIRSQFDLGNPFKFKNISNLKSMEHFDDIGMTERNTDCSSRENSLEIRACFLYQAHPLSFGLKMGKVIVGGSPPLTLGVQRG